jgi:hypothetical protein
MSAFSEAQEHREYLERGRYVAKPHRVCPVCLLISCDCIDAEVAEYLEDSTI